MEPSLFFLVQRYVLDGKDIFADHRQPQWPTLSGLLKKSVAVKPGTYASLESSKVEK